MTARTQDPSLTNRIIRGWMAMVTLPPTLIHEILHCLAAAPVADRVALVIEPTQLHAESQIWWSSDPPAWFIRFVHLIPHLGGLVVGAAVSWYWVQTGMSLPATGGDVLLWCVAAMWWLQVTAPSMADMRGALEAGTGGENS